MVTMQVKMHVKCQRCCYETYGIARQHFCTVRLCNTGDAVKQCYAVSKSRGSHAYLQYFLFVGPAVHNASYAHEHAGRESHAHTVLNHDYMMSYIAAYWSVAYVQHQVTRPWSPAVLMQITPLPQSYNRGFGS